MISRAAAALVVALLLAGCGDSSGSMLAVAGLEQIRGPYQTEPYQAYDPAMLEAFEAECTDGMLGGLDTQYELVLADGRGGGRLLLLYSGRNGGAAECFGRFDETGRPISDGGGSSTGNLPVQLGANELRAETGGGGSSDGGDAWAYVRGNAGSAITRVVFELADGTQITASLASGRFAAWWPGETNTVQIQGYDETGTLVAETSY